MHGARDDLRDARRRSSISSTHFATSPKNASRRSPGTPRGRASSAPTWPRNRIIGVESWRADMEAGRSVGRARPARRHDDARPAGELAPGLGHHRRAAFLARNGDRDRRSRRARRAAPDRIRRARRRRARRRSAPGRRRGCVRPSAVPRLRSCASASTVRHARRRCGAHRCRRPATLRIRASRRSRYACAWRGGRHPCRRASIASNIATCSACTVSRCSIGRLSDRLRARLTANSTAACASSPSPPRRTRSPRRAQRRNGTRGPR